MKPRLVIGLVALVLFGCEQRQKTAAWVPPQAGTYELVSVPRFEPVESPDQLNQYWVRVKNDLTVSTSVEVTRYESGGTNPVELGALSPEISELEDHTIQVNTHYEYVFSFRNSDGSLRDLRRIAHIIYPDVVLEGDLHEPLKSLRLDPGHPRIRATRLYLKKDLFYWTWGKGLTLEAEKLIVEDGARIGVIRPGQRRYEDQPVITALDRNPQPVVIRAKTAIGTLRTYPAFPWLPKFVPFPEDEEKKGLTRRLKTSLPLPEDLKVPPHKGEVKGDGTYSVMVATRVEDPDGLIRGNQEFRIYVEEDCPFDVKVGFPPIQEQMERLAETFHYRTISFHKGHHSSIFVADRFYPTAEWSGINTFHLDQEDPGSFIDPRALWFHFVVSPLDGHVFSISEIRSEGRSHWKVEDWKNESVGMILLSMRPQFRESLKTMNPNAPALSATITPYRETSDTPAILKELNQIYEGTSRLLKTLRPDGVWVDLEVAAHHEPISFSRAVTLVNLLNQRPEALVTYCRRHKIHTVLLTTSETQKVHIDDGTLVLPQDSLLSPDQILEMIEKLRVPSSLGL